MQKIFFVSLMLLIFSNSVSGQSFLGPPSEEYLARRLDIMVDQALEAYNAEDYIKFYENFSTNMDAVTTKRYFEAVYLETYKKNLGAIISKRLLRDETFINPDFPVLVYIGKFQKHDLVMITVNFTKQYGDYWINQIRFDRIHF